MMHDKLLRVIQQANKDRLTRLDLSGMGLTSLPPEIGQLSKLNTLNLNSNQLTSLPPEIGQLSNLKTLNLNFNQLTSLPPEIGQLSKLNTLNLNSNELTSLPPEIGRLSKLNTLYLWKNRLTSLPVEIGQLSRLSTLNLSNNQLMGLPVEFGKLTNLRSVELFQGNPFLSLPPEIRENGWKSVLYFYRQQLEQKTDRLYEAKLLIIGEGGAGKTTLAKKIQNPGYQLQEDEISTDGIEIIQYRFPLENGKEFQVNIWDFGGQQIYHQTHQFFLTKRSLYALVADARKEDTDFYYWLNVVELLSGSSPLLIVKNEKQNIKLEINERQLRGEFTNLEKTFAANFADNRGLSEIVTGLKHYICILPHVGTELPKTWVKVREAMEKEPRDYISLDEYLQICQNNGFTRLEDKLQLSGYLHDLGVCLHFQEDDLLRQTVILKPTWGTDAVYKVLRNPQVTQNLGKFTRADLAIIWRDVKYATMRPELLRLMMNFKLCYEIPNRPGNYIAPQLLSPEQPEYEWDESNNLLLRYEYEFMPKGILTRFIVELHLWIEQSSTRIEGIDFYQYRRGELVTEVYPLVRQQSCVWKTGVVLSKDNARAEIIELYRYHKGEIHVRVSGKRQRDLLAIVRHKLDEIYASYERLKYKTLVPCNCEICKGSQNPHFYPLQVLHKFLDDKQKEIQCQSSYQMVNVRALVDDIVPGVTSAQKQRSQAQQDSLRSTHDLMMEKLARLRHDWGIETGTARKFQLENEIKAEEAQLAQLAAKLDELEQNQS